MDECLCIKTIGARKAYLLRGFRAGAPLSDRKVRLAVTILIIVASAEAVNKP